MSRWQQISEDVEILTESIDGAAEILGHGVAGARWSAEGFGGLYRGGRAARWEASRTVIGASMLQTPGGVVSELERINSDMMVFSKEITDFVEAHGYPTSVPEEVKPIVSLFTSVWSPFIREWQAFYAKNSGWFDNLWWNHAPEAEQYQEQLVAIREQARSLGMAVLSPEPAKPAVGPIEAFLSAIFGIFRTIVYAGIAIAGAWSLWTMYKDVRALR